jgi:predicted proteasome-type protease
LSVLSTFLFLCTRKKGFILFMYKTIEKKTEMIKKKIKELIKKKKRFWKKAQAGRQASFFFLGNLDNLIKKLYRGKEKFF